MVYQQCHKPGGWGAGARVKCLAPPMTLVGKTKCWTKITNTLEGSLLNQFNVVFLHKRIGGIKQNVFTVRDLLLVFVHHGSSAL